MGDGAAAMLVMSILLSPLSSRVGMPVLLIFLVVGMLMGEDGAGGIRFDDFELAFVIGNLALAVILLDGGMRTRAETFRVGLKPALVLATVGVFVTAALAGLCAWLVFDLHWLVALLIGAKSSRIEPISDSESSDPESGEILDLGGVQEAIDQLREVLGGLEQSLENLRQP